MSQIWDRLVGRVVDVPDRPVVPGRYRLTSNRGYVIPPILDGTTRLADIEVPALSTGDRDSRAVSMRAIASLEAADSSMSPVLALGMAQADGDVEILAAHSRAETHIRKVMANPAEILSRTDELMGSGRSGRITPRTLRRLASHANDWRWRRGRRVEPSRLLLERLDADVDRAENRMAINVAVELEGRYALMRADLEGQQRMANPDMLNLHQRVLHRSSSLWLQTFADESLSAMLEHRHMELTDATRRVARLRSTRLGASLPWRVRQADGAFGSNLVRSHESYAEVARLWWTLMQGASLDHAARLAEAVEEERRYDSYVGRCVDRAVDAWCPSGSSPTNLLESVSVATQADGSVAIEATAIGGHRHRVVVVPIMADPSGVLASRTPTSIHRPEQPVVLAALAGTGSLQHVAFGRASLVGLGPYAFTGVESLGAALRWHLEAAEVLCYPQRLRPPRVIADVLRQIASHGFDFQWTGVDLQICDVTFPGDVVRLVQDALPFSARSQDLARPLTQLECACEWMRRLRRCPACGTSARRLTTEGDTFRADCPQCGAKWGIDHCADAGHRRPFFWLKATDLDPGMDQWAPWRSDQSCPFCIGSSLQS